MNIILLGAPGAGKGTEASLIVDQYKLPHISTGDIFRENIKNGTPIGLQAKSYIDQGLLVPDEVTCKIVEDRISREDCKDGYMLDGFPRTIAQAEALDKMGITLDCVVSLEVSDETIVERMSGRRVCSGCGKTYHTIYNPSKTGDKCDACGVALNIRADDAPEVVRSRLEVYHSTTEPLKDFYREKGNLRLVMGASEVEETTKRTLSALGI